MISETVITENGEEIANTASPLHGEISTTITGYLFMYLLQNNVGRVFDGRTTFELDPKLSKKEPDVSFIRRERLPRIVDDAFVKLAPDLAVEVISSNDDWKDVVTKAVTYLKLGVKLVWVIAPYTETAFIFT